jgi:hypothetical protein
MVTRRVSVSAGNDSGGRFAYALTLRAFNLIETTEFIYPVTFSRVFLAVDQKFIVSGNKFSTPKN